MSLNGRLFLSPLLLAASLVAYGAPPATRSFANLNGNWKLAGDQQLGRYPALSIDLAVSGNHIAGAGWFYLNCSEKNQKPFGGERSFIGQIASDGTFTLTPFPNMDHIAEVKIKGVVPSDGSKTWSGTYTFTIPPKPAGENPYSDCTSTQSGSFTAAAFAPVSGTYVGTVSGKGFGPGVVTVEVHIFQETPVLTPASLIGVIGPVHIPDDAPLAIHRWPLNATISVQGSPCFAHGTSTQPADGSDIYGDHFGVNFKMDGGSFLMVTGWFSDPGVTTLHDVHYAVGGMHSNCLQAQGTGILTKQ